MVKNYLKGHVEQRIENITGADVSIGKLSGRLPQEFVFDNILISDRSNSEDTLFQASQVGLHVNVWELLFNTVSVNHIYVNNPKLILDFQKFGKRASSLTNGSGTGFSRFGSTQYEVLAPNVSIDRGQARIANLPNQTLQFPDELSIKNLNLDLFLELNPRQQYIDIAYMGLELPELEMAYLDIRGQFYKDGDYLEWNGFRIGTKNSIMFLFGEVAGADIASSNLQQELRNGYYNIRLDTLQFWPQDFIDLVPDLPDFEEYLGMQAWLEGDIGNLVVRDFKLGFDDSFLSVSGEVDSPLHFETLSYKGIIRELQLNTESKYLPSEIKQNGLSDLGKIELSGNFSGNLNEITLEKDVLLAGGKVQLDTKAQFDDSFYIHVDSKIENLSTEFVNTLSLPLAKVSGIGTVRGTFSERWSPNLFADFNFWDVSVNNLQIDTVDISGIVRGRNFDPNIRIIRDSELIIAESSVQIGDGFLNIWMDGNIEKLNIQDYASSRGLPFTELNLDFMMDIQANRQADLSYGWISTDIQESIINQDTVRAHQFFGDLDSPGDEIRSFRFTSSFLDIIMDGNVNPVSVNNLSNVWLRYFRDRFTDEVLLRGEEPLASSDHNISDALSLEILAEVKDISLLRYYIPILPVDASLMNVQARLNVDANDFEFAGNIQDPDFVWNGLEVENGNFEVYANFNRFQRFVDFSVVDIEGSAQNFVYQNQTAREPLLDLTIRDGRLLAIGRSNQIGDAVILDSEFEMQLTDGSVEARIERMVLGSPEYTWQVTNTPSFVFTGDSRIEISNLRLENNGQLLNIDGVFSNNSNDELRYEISNLALGPISDFINGRVSFDGTLSSEVYTRSLLTNPIADGELFIDGFSIDDGLVGDITFTSFFNPDTRQFETKGEILTPEEKYADILSRDYATAQEIYISGIIESLETAKVNGRNFHFDVDVVNSDIWYLPILVRGLFEQTAGQASGTGVVTGSFDYIDFEGELVATNSVFWPVFFNTRYDVSGPISISRQDGVELRDIQISDGNGGTGVLYGTFDFNEFQDERFLDFTLEKNRLMFLNSDYDPDIPFYGNVYGSGITNVSGSNNAPFVRTLIPVSVTSSSSLSIPLLPEGNIAEQGRFIHFVDDFLDLDTFDSRIQEAIQISGIDRSFTELFRLDLQFVAENPANFRLIFDPVTDEVMSARGTGRMRILLEDETYQMFGRFDIEEGDYSFVGGDIFTRRFLLRDGGSVIWDGDPVNARLNVEAAYRSRPNVNVLLGLGPDDAVQRIPVDLILQITGTIESVENDFYFEFPNTIDATQNAAVLSILNSEEQKFMQATSLLLTGGFLPVGIEGQSDEFIALTQSRAGQVGVSQLLSAQINSILNANLANLDIDLNLTGFDQADLGIAVRLFDDRLVLRRDGQVGGVQNEQADIYGDLGAKYRINNALTVEVFHRKDASILALGATQAEMETVNGIGLEAQVQFNSWRELRNRIWGGFKGIFARRDDMDNDSDPMASR